jgi:glycosyltransferase involved in cell wall biosynthesis
MKSLSLFRAPRQQRSGDDAFSPAFAEALTPYFRPVILADIWPDWHHTALNTFPLSYVPFRHRIYNRTIMYTIARNAVRRLGANGVVCVRGEMWMGDATATLEREIKQRNAYVYNYIDNWFALPALAARAKARCALADAIVVPTPRLQEICEELFPGKTIVAIEEPVDCGRFGPAVAEKAKVPTLVWAGGPFSQSELVHMRDILAAVYRACPFQLVVLSGYKEPDLPLTIPWTWVPYSPANEQEIIPKAWAGFCWLGDDTYASAKGCYKTKTYMAAGTAPVVTDVGHARQVLNAAGAGFLIADNNAQQWIDTLVHLLSSREEAVLEGVKARAFARDAFAYDRIAAEWAHVIHEVC